MPEPITTVAPGGEATPPKEGLRTGWTQRPWLKTEPLLRALLVLLIIITSLFLTSALVQVVSHFSALLVLFFAAWLVALLLNTPVKTLVRMGWPKLMAIAVSYIGLLAVIAIFIVLVLPGLIAQTQLLITNLGGLTNELERTINGLLKGFNLTSVDLGQVSSQLQTIATELLRNALGLATGIANFLVQLLLMLIISFSLLAGRDYQGRTPRTAALEDKNSFTALYRRLPERWRRRMEYMRLSFERNFGVFLGGQLLISFIYGLATWIIMWIAGFDYPVTTGCICGALMIIPFFGGPLSLLPPLLVGFSRNDSPIFIVLLILFAIQTVLLNIILPKLVGKSSGVGPVTTLFVLLAGAQVAGIFGVLLAVPIVGVAKSVLLSVINEFLAREEINAVNATLSVTRTETPGKTETVEKLELDIGALVSSEKK